MTDDKIFIVPSTENLFDVDTKLCFEAKRFATFTKQWPYQDKNLLCCPQKMAEAGFYHCPFEGNDDLVRCFVCYKELVGWEPSDEPWQEHKSHSPACFFAVLGKRQEDMTITEFIRVIGHMMTGILARRKRKDLEETLKAREFVNDLVEEKRNKIAKFYMKKYF